MNLRKLMNIFIILTIGEDVYRETKRQIKIKKMIESIFMLGSGSVSGMTSG